MTFRRPIKLPFESTMAFSKIFTVLPKTGGTLKTFLTIHFFVDLIPLVYFLECSSSAVSMIKFHSVKHGQILHQDVISFHLSHHTMLLKDGLDGKKMQGKSEAAMRMRSFRASKRAPT